MLSRHYAKLRTLAAIQNRANMNKEEFKGLLISATNQAKRFALNYIINQLPTENVYNVQLSLSHDDPRLTQFDIYPDDNGKVFKMADVETVVKTLHRNDKVPVWIDISVSEIKNKKTVLTLLCAGRYSDNEKELYYHEQKMGPFGVKSPNLPTNFKDGEKFKIPEKKKSILDLLFERYRR
jgi:hypothetical protein